MGEENEDTQRLKKIAASAYDYDRDPRWPDYWSNVLVPPHMKYRSAVVDHFKRKFYKRYIDPELVVEALSSGSSSQSSRLPAPSTTSAAGSGVHAQNQSAAASYEYDVFLSFRGDDTRESFTGTLFYSLCKVHKVKTFMDVIFRKGSQLEELLKMVEKSRMSIVVFSENFAESEWCLKELVKIFKERDRRGHEVLPVFYKVNPSELRHVQDSGKTKEHMDKHINKYGKESDIVKSWTKAIKDLGNMSGYTYRSGRGKQEVQLADEIAQEILDRLRG